MILSALYPEPRINFFIYFFFTLNFTILNEYKIVQQLIMFNFLQMIWVIQVPISITYIIN